MPSAKIMWGNWVAIKPDQVRVKVGGAWVAPTRILSKDQSGVFRDWGYSSSPGSPTSFHATGWSFSKVDLAWAAPSGGGPVKHYEVAQNNSNDTVRMSTQTTTGLTASFDVGQDGLYKFYIRSVSPDGLVSPWSGSINVGIGHGEQTAQRWAQRSTPWSSGWTQYGLYNGLITGQATMALDTTTYGFAIGVYITDMKLEVWTPYGWPTLWGFLRTAYWLGNGAADIDGTMQNFDVNLPFGASWVATPFRPRWSNGGAWGIWLSGQGYDDKYGAYKPIYENVQIAGTYYYAELETYTTVAYKDNYYW